MACETERATCHSCSNSNTLTHSHSHLLSLSLPLPLHFNIASHKNDNGVPPCPHCFSGARADALAPSHYSPWCTVHPVLYPPKVSNFFFPLSFLANPILHSHRQCKPRQHPHAGFPTLVHRFFFLSQFWLI